jgi:hypothetical protein
VRGNPSFRLFPYHFILVVCLLLLCFSGQVSAIKFGGAFFYGTPDLHRPFDIVFLVTFGTMCHSSLGERSSMLHLTCISHSVYIYIYILCYVVD